MSTILIVEDDERIRGVLRISLAARGYRVVTAEDGSSALRIAAETAPNLVLLQLGLPDLDGIEVIPPRPHHLTRFASCSGPQDR
ncbi:MAG: response regulator [Actinophytocola sp.]|uniref:response regulator n=1 Tax=Actinophytocola sp. TaxID=1872138 RepID=UPI001327739E|nr:response regulator [Actinophytocola sp.]MPZ85350.1 response regulator [Actinophytocola sp.]